MIQLHRGYLMNIQYVPVSDQEEYNKCFVHFSKHNTNDDWIIHQFYYGEERVLMDEINKWMDEHLSPTLTLKELMSVDGAGI